MQTDASNGLEELLALLHNRKALGKAPAQDDACRDRAALAVAGKTDVRMNKVKAIQVALIAGRYCVPARAVAVRMLHAMLTREGERMLRDRRKRPRVGHRMLIRGSRNTTIL